MRITIGHLYPDQMNIYGDRGNILTLTRRCLWRGIEVDVVPIGVGSSVEWNNLDIVFFGGGQDSGQALIASDLVTRLGDSLKAAIDDGLVVLAICGGYQLLGHYFLTHTGEKLPGIGAMDLHTVGGDKRLIGNIVVQAELLPGTRTQETTVVKLVGFENHSGQTFLGTGVRPLGRVLNGYGNNGKDGTEGAVYQNAIGCYMHGSLLPKNPQLADHLLRLALERRYGRAELMPLEDTLELQAQRAMVERLAHG
jgi:hypothetical protein